MRDRLFTIFGALLIGGVVGGGAIWMMARSADSGVLIEGHPASYWVRSLDNDDESARQHAVALLPRFGVAVIPGVIRMLDTATAQDGAVDVLAAIGQPAVTPLIRALESGSVQTRMGAIRALDRMGPTIAAPAATPVSRLLDDDATGPPAAEFLCHVGPNADSVAAALDVLEHGSTGRQLTGLKVLARAPGSDPRIEPALRKALEEKNPAVHVAAFEALCAINPPSVSNAAIMIDHLTQIETRTAARVGLSALGAAAVGPLRECTTRPAREVRVEAVELLAQRVNADPAAAAAVLDFISDTDSIVATKAAASLVSMRQRDLPFVKKQLTSPHAKLRVWAVHELRKEQPPLIDDMAVALDDADESVRNEATEAIRGVWTVDDPMILHAPESKDVQERVKGIRLLPFFRDLKKYDMMLAAMEDAQPEVRLAATRALGRSITSGRAVTRLIEALKSDASPQVRAEAATYLMAARSTSGVQSALEHALHDPDPKVAAAAEFSLRERNIDR